MVCLTVAHAYIAFNFNYPDQKWCMTNPGEKFQGMHLDNHLLFRKEENSLNMMV
jgi:hypothetical protein